MEWLEKIIYGLEKLLLGIAGVLLIGMMALTSADVVGNTFSHPILGTEELVSVMAAITIAFVLPAAHHKKAHIGIDIFYRRLSPFMKKINDLFVSILSGILFFLAFKECLSYASQLKAAGEVSSTLQIPLYIILYCISFGCLVVFGIILLEIFALFGMRTK